MVSTRIALIAAGALSLGGLAYAATQAQAHDEVAALEAGLAAAVIDMPHAIALAEAHAHGKAVRAEIADEKNEHSYEVEVLAGHQLIDVVVDSRDGKIVSASADKPDNGDDHDGKD